MKIAFVSAGSVLRTWYTDTGEVATRYTLPDGSQISPITLGWSSGDYAVLEVKPFEIPAGKQVVSSPSYEIVGGKIVETYDVEDIPPDPVPDRVTSRQFFLQLNNMDEEFPGTYDAVVGWVEAQGRRTKDAFERSGSFLRAEPMLQEGFAALQFTEQQIDEFFAAAAVL